MQTLVASILLTLSCLISLSQERPNLDSVGIVPLLDLLSSPDIEERCKAQSVLDDKMKGLSQTELKQVLTTLFSTADPEHNSRLYSGLKDTFYTRNFVDELGFLGIEIAKAQLSDQENSMIVIVGGLVPGGPASKAGLLEGDILLKIDGQEIKGPQCDDQMRSKIASKGAGAICKFTVRRDNESFIKEVTLAPRKEFVPKRLDFIRSLTEREKLSQFQNWLLKESSNFKRSKIEQTSYSPNLEFEVSPVVEEERRFFR